MDFVPRPPCGPISVLPARHGATPGNEPKGIQELFYPYLGHSAGQNRRPAEQALGLHDQGPGVLGVYG